MPINPYTITFNKLANHVNPDWTLDEWLLWPPDMFALCALVVNRTGLYKLCLLDAEWWNTKEWESDIAELSKLWIKSSSNQLLRKADNTKFREKPVLKKYYDVLEQEFKTPVIDLLHLRVLGDLYKRDPKPEHAAEKEFAKALLFLFILADASCAGLGFLGQPLAKENLEHRIFMTVANLLLNNTGSLSTINKFHGVVLPKMRTPQAGMVARSLSHHLTFHTTEVEVIWRTFPKLEAHKQSLNILAVPYPKKIEPADFELVPDSYQPVRYFKGNTEKAADETFLDALVTTVLDFAGEKNEVDLITFPEMSLTEEQYLLLLEKFSAQFSDQQGCLQLPVVIAGIMKKNTGYPGVDDTFQNEVRMAVFFAGEWYTTTQRKHHRWQLGGGQIRQYQLEGYFAVDKPWFEYASIAQRRLTILAPNNWLAMTALICEDLARQEPVADVIRGIGPTLLMALLSDGPQLENRWSARYASVLADDPGTAVLSLTSEGMVLRSKPAKPLKEEKPPVVGLWKDMVKGTREFAVNYGSDALMFTISAINQQEYTLDGRSDGGYASVFQLESIEPRQVKFKAAPASLPTAPSPTKKTVGAKEDRWNNIRELSALQYSVDAILDLLGDKKIVPSNKTLAIDLILHLLRGQEPPKAESRKFRERIISNIATAWVDPPALGIGAAAGSGGSERMTAAIADLQLFITLASETPDDDTATLYSKIVVKCGELLKDERRNAADDQTVISVLYNVYNRVIFWHPADPDCFEISGLSISNALQMKADILGILKVQRSSDKPVA